MLRSIKEKKDTATYAVSRNYLAELYIETDSAEKLKLFMKKFYHCL
jgi:hypothetical protein